MKLAPTPLVLLLAMVSWASGQMITDGQWTYIVEDGGATIAASTATGDVTIPSVLGGYAVRKVGGTWPPVFGYPNTSVTSVIIPDGVTSIGDVTFYGCTGLTSVIIPGSVTSIGRSAFEGCTGLTSVIIPGSVTSIGRSAFQGCTGLTSVIIPDGVTSIGENAFYGCTQLTNVTIPDSVTSIGEGAFNNCTGLTSVVIPSRFTVRIGIIGFNGQLATDLMADGLVEAIAQRVIAALPNNYGIATKADLGTAVSDATAQAIAQVQAAPNDYNLFSPTQYQANRDRGREDGIADVIVAPTAYGLYDSTSIMDLRMGGLMIQKQGTEATIVFQPQTTTDLATLPFTNNGPPITNAIPMPGDKGFLRVGAIYVPAGDLTDVLNNVDVGDTFTY